MKRFQYLLGALIFLVIGFLIGWGQPRPSVAPVAPVGSELSVVREVSLMFDEGDGTVRAFEREAFSDGESLFDLTKRVAERTGMSFVHEPPGPYGILITEIDGKRGGTDGRYWLYWVANHLGEVAADQYPLRPGDVVEWKFINLKL
ncbi:DUF4430 domain-containing protein [Candidatus Uhrbacteria bacterium]|nr:DUF4430 domain-containing protein [Candidatus Uhrbacteria bacterium]